MVDKFDSPEEPDRASRGGFDWFVSVPNRGKHVRRTGYRRNSSQALQEVLLELVPRGGRAAHMTDHRKSPSQARPHSPARMPERSFIPSTAILALRPGSIGVEI